MKSTVSSRLVTSPVFPRLMVADDGQVVLFIADRTGTVVKEGCDPIGDYSCSWHMPDFKDFTGTVTLEN